MNSNDIVLYHSDQKEELENANNMNEEKEDGITESSSTSRNKSSSGIDSKFVDTERAEGTIQKDKGECSLGHREIKP